MAKQITTMRDSDGVDVPLKYVSKYDRLRDKIARRVLSRFRKARGMLEAAVKDTLADLDELRGQKDRLGKRGNFSAQSFDGLIQVAIRQQYSIRLDERVIRARELMLEYINGVLDRVNGVDVSALRLLVEAAFKASASGYLSTSKVMTLMRMEVNDAKWREAKLILQDALKPQKGKAYLSCETRSDMQHDFRPIRLDIADCWPEASAAGESNKTEDGKGGDENAD